jgi:peroxiredoxin
MSTFTAGMAKHAPPEVIATVGAEIKKLADARIAERALHVGAKAPDFSLPDVHGKVVKLASLLAKGPTVVTFYRGGWCPFCDLQLRAYQGVLSQILDLGAELVAISPQTPDYALSDVEKKQLTFPVLTDKGNAIARRYGLVFSLSETVRQLQTGFGNPIPNFNGDEPWELPMVGTFVLDRAGVVRLAHADPNYMKRLEPAAILEALRAARAGARMRTYPLSHSVALFAILVVDVLGCSKPGGDSTEAPAASAVPLVSTLTSPAKATPTASAAARPMKEYGAPAPDRVGTLAPGTGIPVAQKVPDVQARDLDGKDVSLSSLYTKGPILLAFYRGGWCPFCNSENHALATAYPEYQKRGVTPVTVSVDTPDAEAKTKATYAIPFPVLSDSNASMIEAFHVVNKVDDATVAKMKGFGVDLEAYSGKTHHEIAVPSLFLIDRSGVVRWAHSDPDYKVRPSTAQILAAIDSARLDGGTAP